MVASPEQQHCTIEAEGYGMGDSRGPLQSEVVVHETNPTEISQSD